MFFVHYESLAVPLGCHGGRERRFAVGKDCLALLPVGSSLFTEGVGSAPSRPGTRECYDQQVMGLELVKEPPYNGFGIWPPENATKVRRIAAESVYAQVHPGHPRIEEPRLDLDRSIDPHDAALLTGAGIKAFGLHKNQKLFVRQVVPLDLDLDGQTDRLFTAGFHSPLPPDPSQEEIRHSNDQLSNTYGLYLITARAPGQVQLLRRYAHTVLGTVDLAGEGQVVLWLDSSDSENLRYLLEVFQKDRLVPLSCFGCGPGNGLTTDCSS